MAERKDTIHDPALLSRRLQNGRDAERQTALSLERLNGDQRREMSMGWQGQEMLPLRKMLVQRLDRGYLAPPKLSIASVTGKTAYVRNCTLSCLGYGLDPGPVGQGATSNGLVKWAATTWLLLNAVLKA